MRRRAPSESSPFDVRARPRETLASLWRSNDHWYRIEERRRERVRMQHGGRVGLHRDRRAFYAGRRSGSREPKRMRRESSARWGFPCGSSDLCRSPCEPWRCSSPALSVQSLGYSVASAVALSMSRTVHPVYGDEGLGVLNGSVRPRASSRAQKSGRRRAAVSCLAPCRSTKSRKMGTRGQRPCDSRYGRSECH